MRGKSNRQRLTMLFLVILGSLLPGGARATMLLFEREIPLVGWTYAPIGEPRENATAIVGFEFQLFHYPSAEVPIRFVPDVSLFDGLVLDADSIGQTYRITASDPNLQAFSAVVSDGNPGSIGDQYLILYADGTTYLSGGGYGGECAFLFTPNSVPCVGSTGASPDYAGAYRVDELELTAHSFEIRPDEITSYYCPPAGPCTATTSRGYLAFLRLTLKGYGTVVPEPGSAVLIGIGLGALARRPRCTGGG